VDLEPDRFDPIVAKSPVKVCPCSQVSSLIRADDLQTQASGITKTSPVHVRRLVESEPRQFEMNPDNGEPPEDGIHSLPLPRPIMVRMPVGVLPEELFGVSEGMEGIAQSTPTTLRCGPHQSEQTTFRKPKVTFATTLFKGKETVRSVQNDVTPRSGALRGSIFEDDVFGMNSAWKRTPAKVLDKHSTLIGVRGFALIRYNEERSRC
jgi:hypothetical protein